MKAKLLHIFMMDFSRGWGVREHSHAFYQIWYILAGQAEYLLDGKRVTIHANDMVFMPPGISHELPVMQDGLLRYVDIKFRIDDEQLQKECTKLPLIMQLDNKEIHDAIIKCRECWYESDQYSFEISKLLFEQVLLLILKERLDTKKTPLWLPTIKGADDLSGVAAEIADYIDIHYAEEFSLEKMAGIFRYNKAYLCKRFKEATGMTIVNYLNYVRIVRAYDLICYTSDSISNISLTVGFSSVHYFTRLFKKICGVPPGGIRDMQKDSVLRDTRLHGNFSYRYYEPQQDTKAPEKDADIE